MWRKTSNQHSIPVPASTDANEADKNTSSGKAPVPHSYPLMTPTGQDLGANAPFKWDSKDGFYKYRHKLNFESTFKILPLMEKMESDKGNKQKNRPPVAVTAGADLQTASKNQSPPAGEKQESQHPGPLLPPPMRK